MTAGEAYQVRHSFMATMNGFENLFVQTQEAGSLLDLDEVARMVYTYLNEPWVDGLWEQNRAYFGNPFQDFVAQEVFSR